jgi:assimilatory nitrate reductase catalytic subunit
MYHSTETAQRAHLVLPAAGWGEKEGTFINSERRIGMAKKVARAPGEALADFHIFRLVAHYWGCGHLFREWTSPQATFQILKRLSAGRPCDFTGIDDYRHLDRCGGIQWPLTETWNAERETRNENSGATDSAFRIPRSAFTERRLFADGRFFTPDGKARFIFEAPRPLPEQTDTGFPLILLTGRSSSAQWHTLTRTGKSDILQRLSPRGLFLEMHPDDAKQLGVRANGPVRVISRRGEIEAKATITSSVQRGQVFLPMHDPTTNCLTLPAFDPHSRQPGYKFCAVRVVPVRPRR